MCRSASVSATCHISSSVGPVCSGYWIIASRSSAPRTQVKNRLVRLRAQVIPNHFVQIPKANPAPQQFLTIPRFAQIRLTTKLLRPLFDRVLERQMLEGVQGVVMDEDVDRTLRGQQVRRVLTDILQVRERV